jgi:hypothetical protein
LPSNEYYLCRPAKLKRHCTTISVSSAPILTADDSAALAALGSEQKAPVRLAILDLTGDGFFKEDDAVTFIEAFAKYKGGSSYEPGNLHNGSDPSRFDLNGDGTVGTDETASFNGHKGSQRCLKFCEQCPHSDYCGMNFSCGLSEDGDPQQAFHLASIPASVEPAAPLGLQPLLDTQDLGQIWLNDIDTVYELLYVLESMTLEIWTRWWNGEVAEGEAEFLEQLLIEWYAKMFRGLNPRYAVLKWNCDPGGLNRYIVEKYYVEENEYNLEDCPHENAIEGILDCCSATARFAIREMASGERHLTEEDVTRIWEEIASDALYHTPFMLGIPGTIKFSDKDNARTAGPT